MSDRRARILFLTVGDRDSPGTRLRALAYVPFLEARGHFVRVLSPLRSGKGRFIPRTLELARDLLAARRFDVVVVYRKTFPRGTARLLRGADRKLVYEFDDAVYLPSPSEPRGPRVESRYRRNFAATVRHADLVVAGNAHLAAAVTGNTTAIVPTAVDLEVFRPRERPDSERCVIGWIGTAENLPQWERLLPAFQQVTDACPAVRYKLVSDREPPASYPVPVDFERFSIEREADGLRDFDIGIMPLEDTPWNRGKCSAKALQCMALAMPVVLSPVGMNHDVVEPEVSGLLATSQDEWVAALSRLARDPDLRRRMGRAARKTVEERYSLEAIGNRLADLVEQLL